MKKNRLKHRKQDKKAQILSNQSPFLKQVQKKEDLAYCKLYVKYLNVKTYKLKTASTYDDNVHL